MDGSFHDTPTAFAELLTGTRDGGQKLQQSVDLAIESIQSRLGDERVFSGETTADMVAHLARTDVLPQRGLGVVSVARDVGDYWIAHALNVNSPRAMAHLHCPVTISGVVAEVLIAATNQSMDSWDQSPLATLIEDRVLETINRHIGMPEQASGCFTSGGSQSNFTALYLAIEKFPDIDRRKMIVLTSENAHFSVTKNARILGLATDAVHAISTDDDGRMSPAALCAAIERCRRVDAVPVAIFATAGTTDLGSIDPLPELADVARRYGIWLHVDAAYGGGLLFSRHRNLVAGIADADSITLDFHKMLLQPISCSALLVRDGNAFAPLAFKADYLNPEDAVFAMEPNLVERSVQTTRRADALKVFMAMRALGQDGFGTLIDKTIENTQAAARLIRERLVFSLAHDPVLSTVVFRYQSPHGIARANMITTKVREELLRSGRAAIATTKLNGVVHFKFTLLNPRTEPPVIADVLDDICTSIQNHEAAA